MTLFLMRFSRCSLRAIRDGCRQGIEIGNVYRPYLNENGTASGVGCVQNAAILQNGLRENFGKNKLSYESCSDELQNAVRQSRR